MDALSEADEGLPHFTDRLNAFITAARWQDDDGVVRAHTPMTLAAELGRRGVPTTQVYIYRLRSGVQSNPSARLVLGLSGVLGVSPLAWFDEQAARDAEAALTSSAAQMLARASVEQAGGKTAGGPRQRAGRRR